MPVTKYPMGHRVRDCLGENKKENLATSALMTDVNFRIGIGPDFHQAALFGEFLTGPDRNPIVSGDSLANFFADSSLCVAGRTFS